MRILKEIRFLSIRWYNYYVLFEDTALMKTTLNFILICAFCFSCVESRSRKVQTSSDRLVDSTPQATGFQNQAPPAPPAPGSTNNDPTAGNQTPGFEHCNWLELQRFSHSTSIGTLQICQNQYNHRFMRIKVSKDHQTEFLCFVPTRSDENGNSYYIGLQTRNCIQVTANTIMEGYLSVDRPGFTHIIINSLMVMKKNVSDKYYRCMYEPNAAERNRLCTEFRTQHANDYYFVQLPAIN